MYILLEHLTPTPKNNNFGYMFPLGVVVRFRTVFNEQLRTELRTQCMYR